MDFQPKGTPSFGLNVKVKDFGVKGRGLIAKKKFQRGDLVEEAHCIFFPESQVEAANSTALSDYTFKWGGGLLLALNFGSLFNHSSQPNIDYRIDGKNRIIRYFASRTIEIDEELTIFYGHNLWFSTPEEKKETIDDQKNSEEFGDLFSEEN